MELIDSALATSFTRGDGEVLLRVNCFLRRALLAPFSIVVVV